MKYNRKGTELLRPEQAESQKFGIKDPAMLIEILRDKLYSNKIRVICQEYLSNGRDAHREIGNEKTPLEVKLPTATRPQLEIRDFGPGITPDRMSDVFCFFGESTKRDTNKATGGFGIGAKSAWSYSEQFGVMTYVDGKLRHYSMAIDETRTGEMILIHTEDTKEPNGTKIIVPIKNQDFRSFEEWVYRTTQWWEVRPDIIGKCGYRGWTQNYKQIKKGDGWILTETNFGYNNHAAPTAVVDGIEYPIIADNIEDLDKESRNILNHNIFIFFNTGEIEVAANREQLDYMRKTQSIIRLKCKKIVESIKENLSKDIEKAKTYWDAQILWNKVVNNSNLKHIVHFVDWVAPDGTKLKVNGNRTTISDKVEYHNVWKLHGDIKRKSRYGGGVEFKEDWPLLINDAEKIPSVARLLTIWKKYKDDQTFQAITITPKHDEDAEAFKKRVDKFIKDSHICYMPHIRMSEVEKQKIVRVKSDGSGQKKKAVTYNVYSIPDTAAYDSYPKCNIDLSKVEGYYVPFEASYLEIGKGKVHVKSAYSEFKAAFDLLGIDPKVTKVYAIPNRFMDKVPDDCKLKKLNVAINKKLDDMMNNSKVSMVDLAFMNNYEGAWNDPFNLRSSRLLDHKDKFDDPNNLLLKLFERIDEIQVMIRGINPWIQAQKKLGNGVNYGKLKYDRWGNSNNSKNVLPDAWVELNEMMKEVSLYMPLVEHVSVTNYNRRRQHNTFINGLIDYTNMCQERFNEAKSKMSLAI